MGMKYREIGRKSFAKIELQIGDRGGYIEKEVNLSTDGNAWIYDNARVKENAFIGDNARVYGNVCLAGNARLLEYGVLWDNVEMFQNAKKKHFEVKE